MKGSKVRSTKKADATVAAERVLALLLRGQCAGTATCAYMGRGARAARGASHIDREILTLRRDISDLDMDVTCLCSFAMGWLCIEFISNMSNVRRSVDVRTCERKTKNHHTRPLSDQ